MRGMLPAALTFICAGSLHASGTIYCVGNEDVETAGILSLVDQGAQILIRQRP